MLNQIDLISAIAKEIDRQGVKTICARQMNAVIHAANEIIRAMSIAPVMAAPAMGLVAWMASDDTGSSSKYMAAVMSGVPGNYAHPHDTGDFGRCSRLLDAVPEFRDKMEMMRDKSPQWAALLDAWSDIESLIESGDRKAANGIIVDCLGY